MAKYFTDHFSCQLCGYFFLEQIGFSCFSGYLIVCDRVLRRTRSWICGCVSGGNEWRGCGKVHGGMSEQGGEDIARYAKFSFGVR